MPFFNEEDTLRFTLDALLRQSLKAERVLMIDSGSNDSSAEIIEEYIRLHKSIELFQPMLGSPSSSINFGLKHIRTKYVAYVDCGLEIPKNWLESQHKLITNNNLIVSTQIYTVGISSLDKSLIAHTYGYKNKTTCLPGSLMDTSIFKMIGNFEENVRAGYDVDFINRINNNGIERIINNKIHLKYIGTNYAKNYIEASKKVFNYSLSGWKTKGDYKPYSYIFFLIMILISIMLNFFIELSLFYIIVRGYFIPFMKSENLFKENNISFYLMLPISAIVFDISRSLGYIASIRNLVEYGK